MPRLTNLWRLVLLPRPVFFLRSRDGDAGGEHQRPARDDNDRDSDSSRHANERLERIALYARAGYFHMHTTLDMMHTVGEIPPD